MTASSPIRFAVRLPHRIFALLTLLGWFFAAGHVFLSHGGTADGGATQARAAEHGDNDDHDGNAPEHDGHHHDLTPYAPGQSAKTLELKALAPVLVPLCDTVAARLTAQARVAQDARRTFDFGESPPDERAFGWLFVVQTARPVRGPSSI